MTLPHFWWQGHLFWWEGHLKVWQRHYFKVCSWEKNDLTHQTNVFATPINDFATFLVARSYICVAKS
jgi:hypothetical protein